MSKRKKAHRDQVLDSETGRLAYEKAREEILHRINHRDRVLMLYLVAIATTFGAVLAMDTPEYNVLYVSPFLSVGTGLLVYHHNLSVSDLVSFIRRELAGSAPVFETFNMRSSEPRGLKIRSAGEMILLVVPCIACLSINVDDLCVGRSGVVPWVGSLLASIGVVLISVHMAWARSSIANADIAQLTKKCEPLPEFAHTEPSP